jgi:5-hydroxyisourate hydrolase-like protein (transthyretin family)
MTSTGQASKPNYNCGMRVEALSAFLVALLTLAAAAGCSSGGPGAAESAGVKATYSKATGKLELITYDTNKDGKVDAWSHMDGTRLVSMDIDRDFDGKPDRWEYYAADGALEKVGMSRAGDGTVDAWAFQGPDGAMERMEVDTDHDGRVDTWETYRNGALASVELDTTRDGKPDRRLTYGPGGVKAERPK